MSTFDEASGIKHYDVRNPEDLQYLIETGVIWKGGPKAIAAALQAIRTGAVARPANLPAWAAAALDGAASPATAPVAPGTDLSTPGDQPDSTPPADGELPSA